MVEVVSILGIAAGILTTLAGQGGGVLLLLTLALFVGPHDALVATAPALLFGNVHRAAMCRVHIDRVVARRLIAGALPGSIAGGLLVGEAPAILLKVMLLGTTGLAVAKAFGRFRWTPPPGALVASGAVVGAMAATAGGAGLLLAPVLLTTGLSGVSFVATGAITSVAVHTGRMIAYGHAGLFRADLAVTTVVLAVAILVGNLAGDRLRPLLTKAATTRIELGTMAICVALAVTGITS